VDASLVKLTSSGLGEVTPGRHSDEPCTKRVRLTTQRVRLTAHTGASDAKRGSMSQSIFLFMSREHLKSVSKCKDRYFQANNALLRFFSQKSVPSNPEFTSDIPYDTISNRIEFYLCKIVFLAYNARNGSRYNFVQKFECIGCRPMAFPFIISPLTP
jgi:hypothetical protein